MQRNPRDIVRYNASERLNHWIVGFFFIGLVSGTCLASVGHQVACVDVDAAKVERINRGEPPIHGLPCRCDWHGFDQNPDCTARRSHACLHPFHNPAVFYLYLDFWR